MDDSICSTVCSQFSNINANSNTERDYEWLRKKVNQVQVMLLAQYCTKRLFIEIRDRLQKRYPHLDVDVIKRAIMMNIFYEEDQRKSVESQFQASSGQSIQQKRLKLDFYRQAPLNLEVRSTLPPANVIPTVSSQLFQQQSQSSMSRTSQLSQSRSHTRLLNVGHSNSQANTSYPPAGTRISQHSPILFSKS